MYSRVCSASESEVGTDGSNNTLTYIDSGGGDGKGINLTANVDFMQLENPAI